MKKFLILGLVVVFLLCGCSSTIDKQDSLDNINSAVDEDKNTKEELESVLDVLDKVEDIIDSEEENKLVYEDYNGIKIFEGHINTITLENEGFISNIYKDTNYTVGHYGYEDDEVARTILFDNTFIIEGYSFRLGLNTLDDFLNGTGFYLVDTNAYNTWSSSDLGIGIKSFDVRLDKEGYHLEGELTVQRKETGNLLRGFNISFEAIGEDGCLAEDKNGDSFLAPIDITVFNSLNVNTLTKKNIPDYFKDLIKYSSVGNDISQLDFYFKEHNLIEGYISFDYGKAGLVDSIWFADVMN